LSKIKVTLLSQWYPPAYKAGGPIQSVFNLVEVLKEEYECIVGTSNYDIDGSPISFDNEATISTISKYRDLKILLKENKTIVYVNSMFSWLFGIAPLLLTSNILISPRGMLKTSALKNKPFKKQLFLSLGNLFNIYKHAHFIASNEAEKNEIIQHIKQFASITILPNVGALPIQNIQPIEKLEGTLKLLFVGRIHRIKNLDFLLRTLKNVNAPVQLEVVGPKEDVPYWNECLKQINNLEQGHQITLVGPEPPVEINRRQSGAHFLISPTKGENFGHAILNSLCRARPVIISDQTPWQNLEQNNCGWELPLEEEQWVKILNLALSLNQEQFNLLCNGSLKFANENSNHEELKRQYLDFFKRVSKKE